MISITPPNYRYCPFCGMVLTQREEEGKKRKYCLSDKWTYYPRVTQSATALIQKRGKILLVKRARQPYKGTWMMPSGYVDYGEHPADALKREVFEETGLRVEKASLLEVVQSLDDENEPGHLIFIFQAEVSESLPTLENDPQENEAVEWFSSDKLPSIGWKNHRIFLEKYFS